MATDCLTVYKLESELILVILVVRQMCRLLEMNTTTFSAIFLI
jgi:hypothetical protein